MTRTKFKCAACKKRIPDHEPDLVLRDLENGGGPRYYHTRCGEAAYTGGGGEPGPLPAHRPPRRGGGELMHTEIAPGTVIKKKPIRVFGKIRGQNVMRQLPDGGLESATYPLTLVKGHKCTHRK